MALTFREQKGEPLTYKEVDDNFKGVRDFEQSAQDASMQAQQAKAEAEQARADVLQALDDAERHLGDIASVDPEPAKVPLGTNKGTIKQAWVDELEFELDRLRVATNKALYGDGPYPVLDFQFAGAKYLDPRITFTRASKDWDEYGNEYGIDEPVLTDKGLWVSPSRTNLFKNNEGN